MTNGTKKKNRKLRKQIRKTLGGLLMVSAIIIAALPVQDVAANPTEDATKIALIRNGSHQVAGYGSISTAYKSTVPSCTESWVDSDEKTVYTTGDGKFQFVYMRPNSTDANKYAVILGYNSSSGDNSSLTIPETLIAYKKYSDNVSSEGYCLVSKNGGYLYYEDEEQRKDSYKALLYMVYQLPNASGVPTDTEVTEYDINIKTKEDGSKVYIYKRDTGSTDPDTGNAIYEDVEYTLVPIMDTVYSPCYYDKRDEWESISDEDLYYRTGTGTSTNYVKAGTDNQYWKIVADVAYIGEDVIKSDGHGGWVIDATQDVSVGNGAFHNAGNVENLTISGNIWGIGDYAFSNCANLQSVTLGDNLQTIGNGAFADCIRLRECNIKSNASIQAIGKDAFYNCSSLRSFTAPIALKALGDSCFENCIALETVELCGGDGGSVALKNLGDRVFKNCSSLSSLTLPPNYEETDLDLATLFEGCSSLQFIRSKNTKLGFSRTVDYETFKETVPESFYFEGIGGKTGTNYNSNMYEAACQNAIAFKYYDEDLYELIKYEKGTGGTGPGGTVEVTYQVNSANELVNFWIEANGKPSNVTIPETIGPYGISHIGEGSFDNNCALQRVTIPASVTSIGANAFKGCHALETVIFTDATTIQSIGTDAFKTQEITCSDASTVNANTTPKLTLVGTMYNEATGEDTVPFMYAMNGNNIINNGSQERSFITCHSGWPTNMEVRYNYDPITGEGEAELQSYPKWSDLKNNASTWVHNLPYVTSDNEAEYLAKVSSAVTNYTNYGNGSSTNQPTDDEMSVINSALNIVIPNSVDAIKEGIFSGLDSEGNAVSDGYQNKEIETIVLNGVKEVDPYTFAGCKSLREAAIIGPAYLGDYAFDGSVLSSGEEMALQKVTLGTNLEDTGKRPFKACPNLTLIDCLDDGFSYADGILYRNTGNGKEIVECLETRGDLVGSISVGPEELAGVTSIKEEAFMECDEIGKVDLSETTVDVIPESCFEDMNKVNTIILPDTIKNIEARSFANNENMSLVRIPGNPIYMEKDAFANDVPADQQKIIFECVEGSNADRYADEYDYINPEYGRVFLEHTVYFWDYPDYPDTTSKSLFYKTKVKDGEDAVPPADIPEHEGYAFNRWTDHTNVSRDIDVYPVYGSNIWAVTFRDYDGTQLGEVQYVEDGKSAVPPTEPTREGYSFDKWSQDYNNVTEDRTIIALYIDNSGDASRHTVTFYDYNGSIVSQQSVNHGEAAVEPKSPTRTGYVFSGWVPSEFSKVEKDMNIVAYYDVDKDGDGKPDGSGSGNGTGNGSGSSASASASASAKSSSSPSASPSVKKYTVSVSGGSGSGSYAAGEIVAINAFDRGTGQSFDKWTTSTAGVGFANANAVSTTFTMPAANVAITATYKTGSGTGTGTTANGNGSSTASGSSTISGNSGSTVQVTKSGISNTNLAGATVSGSTDNFVIKITDDQTATDAVIAALQAKYGDISRIKYLPMDISLYDSTGRTKIADTSGISVNITMPLPDDLAQYAGNNKAGAVLNGALEELNVRFTTVDGVPCVNFTATHFSPYVIYVDTANLTEGMSDATPKTGDPIHPKWFLAMGMACISLILFFKKDKAVAKTTKLA